MSARAASVRSHARSVATCAAQGAREVVGLTLCAAGFALARRQFGRGVKHVPATNLDVVIVLDYSKSMYARDVVPSLSLIHI